MLLPELVWFGGGLCVVPDAGNNDGGENGRGGSSTDASVHCERVREVGAQSSQAPRPDEARTE